MPSPDRPLPHEPVRPLSHRLVAAARGTLGAGTAIFLSHAFGADHPAWAAMEALAVMQGGHLHISMNRALQRMAGTVVGAILAWILLVQDPSVWTVIVALVLLQIATEMVIGINYAFGQILVTPMALLMTHLAAPHGNGTAPAPERVLDTILGAGVGIAVSVLLSTMDDRRSLAKIRARRDSDRQGQALWTPRRPTRTADPAQRPFYADPRAILRPRRQSRTASGAAAPAGQRTICATSRWREEDRPLRRMIRSSMRCLLVPSPGPDPGCHWRKGPAASARHCRFSFTISLRGFHKIFGW